jgi:hypothetical protein
VVEPELFASLRPPSYSGGLGVDRQMAAAPPPMEPAMANGEVFQRRALREAAKESLGRPAGRGGEGKGEGYYYAEGVRKQLETRRRLNLGGTGVTSAATASKLGDSFQYAIDKPVTLPRQKSALLPIVNKDVEGTRVSIYNEAVQPAFPLLGLKFKNTSGLHLMQGPLTVFEGSNYAGDARVPDLQPGEERLLSYAVDLGTEVNPVPSSDNGRVTQVKVVKGLLHSTTKVRESKAYALKNRSGQERTVLIEHPVRHDFKLVDGAKPAETARDVYRFQVQVPAGKAVTETVTEERQFGTTVQLTTSNDDQVCWFINQPVASAKVKDGLRRALELRGELAKTRREIAEQQRQLTTITDDQARLRANLKEMPSTAQAYKRYLEKFDQQETQIERYQADLKQLQATEHRQRKAFEDFLAAFSAE